MMIAATPIKIPAIAVVAADEKNFPLFDLK
jgi:hypothetical protein